VGDLGQIRNRVDQAVDRLSVANDTRRRQSQGLMTLLTDLESKYEARSEELEHSRRRIEALAHENTDLSDLVEKLVLIVDSTVSADDENPLFRASATAADLVADWSRPEDVAEPVDQADVADDETVSSADHDGDLDDEIAAAPEHDAASEAFAELDPAIGFQDVGDEELASERLDGNPEELAAVLDTPLTPEIDDVVDMATVLEADQPFEAMDVEVGEAEMMDVDVDEVVAVLETPNIDMTDIDMTDIEMSDLDTTALDGPDDIDPIQELLSADLDIPEIVLDDDEPISRIDPDEDTESSIRAMMARLEEAATRARARTEDLPEAEAEPDEAPAMAVGGAG
jgi:hypothetical protein